MRECLFTILYLFVIQAQAIGSGFHGEEDEVFGLFKDLHRPFELSGQEEFSPVYGTDTTLVLGLRVHGHFETVDRQLPRPCSRSIDKTVYPQDALAALLERLFTSHVGLLINSDQKDNIHKWLCPINIALFLRFYIRHRFDDANYDAHDNDDAVRLDLCRVLVPKTVEDLTKQYSKRSGKPAGLNDYLMKQAGLKQPLIFADLLYLAIKENQGEKALKNGYPRRVVVQTLLTFMWLKKKKKMDLKVFYDTFFEDVLHSNDLRHETIRQALAKIVWHGEGSYFTKEDYWRAKQIKGPKSLEISRLLRHGYGVFEDRLPPIRGYGISFINLNNEVFSYSDCGETSLADLLMVFLFDPDLQIFDHTRLERLRELGIEVEPVVIEHFSKFCSTPNRVGSAKVRNHWAWVLLTVFSKEQNKGRIQLLHPTVDNGTHGIDSGLINILDGLGLLLRDPLWNTSETNKPLYQHRLDRLCQIFSPSGLFANLSKDWDWEAPVYDFSTNRALSNKVVKNLKQVNIRFKLGGYHLFEWQISEQHFDFCRVLQSYDPPNKEIQSKKYQIPVGMTEDNFPRYLYNADLDSLQGRLIAINKILWFKRTYHRQTYDALLRRWLVNNGKHLAYFNDPYVNEILMRIMFEKDQMSVDDVLEIGHISLSATMLWHFVQKKDVQTVAWILDYDKVIYETTGNPKAQDFRTLARVVAPAILKAENDEVGVLMEAGLERYTRAVAKMPPLTLAAHGPHSKFARDLCKLVLGPRLSAPNKQDVERLIDLGYSADTKRSIIQTQGLENFEAQITNGYKSVDWQSLIAMKPQQVEKVTK